MRPPAGNGVVMSAVDVMARLIAPVVERIAACEYNGKSTTTGRLHVCITHPADYKQNQLEALMRACLKAGLNKKRVYLLAEPAAAIIGHSHLLATEGKLVFVTVDIGGGTIDLSVILREKDGDLKCQLFEVLSHLGADIGGIDVDRDIIDVVSRKIFRALDVNDKLRIVAVSELWNSSPVSSTMKEIDDHCDRLEETVKSITNEEGTPGTRAKRKFGDTRLSYSSIFPHTLPDRNAYASRKLNKTLDEVADYLAKKGELACLLLKGCTGLAQGRSSTPRNDKGLKLSNRLSALNAHVNSIKHQMSSSGQGVTSGCLLPFKEAMEQADITLPDNVYDIEPEEFARVLEGFTASVMSHFVKVMRDHLKRKDTPDVCEVVLAGGGAHLPGLAEALKAAAIKARIPDSFLVKLNNDPKSLIALGALKLCEARAGVTSNIQYKNVTAHQIGIRTHNSSEMHVLVAANSEIPPNIGLEHTWTGSVTGRAGELVDNLIEVFQGPDLDCDSPQNILLVKFVVRDIVGSGDIDVTVNINSNGLVKVSAKAEDRNGKSIVVERVASGAAELQQVPVVDLCGDSDGAEPSDAPETGLTDAAMDADTPTAAGSEPDA